MLLLRYSTSNFSVSMSYIPLLRQASMKRRYTCSILPHIYNKFHFHFHFLAFETNSKRLLQADNMNPMRTCYIKIRISPPYGYSHNFRCNVTIFCVLDIIGFVRTADSMVWVAVPKRNCATSSSSGIESRKVTTQMRNSCKSLICCYQTFGYDCAIKLFKLKAYALMYTKLL
ncbi:hypothetical protein BDF20DRAFT_835881 [Mycotypha africana]|uniref:uncharacterized protein n=1 Tax=Mycotypha africana TaxID=64632 RepID=UPI0022FFDFF1|nr:uncharacterized protein BDF20DRAFT_835881 [Mycotypha africana]KAI8977045.1 hypothetical protein BDF20DRAFT_835881 [Mycotypha africana]